MLRELTREELDRENRSGIEVESPQIGEVERLLREELGLSALERGPEGRLMIREGVERYREISRLLFDRGIYVSQFSLRHETLEDYFMNMTGGGHA